MALRVGQTFQDAIINLENLGLTDVLLPFLLIFTLIFAVLQKTKILGEEKKNINTMIALVIALLVVIPHVTNSYPSGTDIVEILNTVLPQISLLIVAILMLIVVVGIFYPTTYGIGSWSGVAAIIGIIGLIWIFGAATGWFGGWDWFVSTFGEETITLVIVILVFAIIVYLITREQRTPGTRMLEGIDRMFRGPGR